MKKIVLCLVLVLSVGTLIAGEHGKHGEDKGKHEGKSCDMSKHEARAVEMTGKLLCKHCNLHQTEECEKVFQPAGDEKTLYAICENSKGDLEALSEEGTATLKVKGKLVKCGKDGSEELMIEEISKV
jgi:hypothetical protein